MNTSGNTWAIVLAAGEGSRLRSLTTTEAGIAIPKQFCSLSGGKSLLREALQRAAIGILLPLLHIVARDPDARVVLLPSDHHVRDEHVLAAALQEAVRKLEARRDHVLLLGISPEEADPDLGTAPSAKTRRCRGRWSTSSIRPS